MTPLTEMEYMVGKTFTGSLVAVVLVLLYVSVLGVSFSLAGLLAVTLAGVIFSMIFGYLVEFVSSDQLTAIASAKIGAMLFIIPPVVTLVSRGSEIFLSWLPTYWTFAGYRSLFWEGGTWPEVLPFVTWNMAANLAFTLLARAALKKYAVKVSS